MPSFTEYLSSYATVGLLLHLNKSQESLSPGDSPCRHVQVKQEEEAASKMTTSTGGKYVPPFMKEGAKAGGVSMMSSRGRGERRLGHWRGL